MDIMKKTGLDLGKVKDGVFKWMETMRDPGPGFQYRLSRNSGHSIFCACFSLFIMDLFGEVLDMPKTTRNQWVSYIQGFQNQATGYFEPATYFHKDKDRIRHQLTSLCLSALSLLQKRPKYPLKFVEQWKNQAALIEYLSQIGADRGIGGSGNKAMFVAIFLTHEYENTGDERCLALMDAWFDFHDCSQNRHGLWGTRKSNLYYAGLQNGYHQLEVYFYWKRPVAKLDQIVDVVLEIQDNNGLFGPAPGGGPCKDYDAIHILAEVYGKQENKAKNVETALAKALKGVLGCRNEDGGFCRSKLWPAGSQRENVKRFVTGRTMRFIFNGYHPYLWLYRLKIMAFDILRNNSTYVSSWVKGGHPYFVSDIFSTWFRCLALAQIAVCLYPDDPMVRKLNFQKTIGIGFF